MHALASAVPASTLSRVPLQTSSKVNERIAKEAANNVSSLFTLSATSKAGVPSAEDYSRRLSELAREWDIERVLECNASLFGTLGLLLGHFVSRYWFLFTTAILLFLLQHAVQGWCPPLPLFRSMLGVRTQAEIDDEKMALKLLRGDFNELVGKDKREVLEIFRRNAEERGSLLGHSGFSLQKEEKKEL